MTTENLERYLSGVFEIELNIFVQENIINRMKNTYNNLGQNGRISKPTRRASNVNVSDYMFAVGGLIGVITGIIAGIIEYNDSNGGFWWFLGSIFIGIVYAIIGLIAGTGLKENACHLPSVAGRCLNQTKSVQDAKDTLTYADA